jgi:hypothetical protein
MESINGSSFRVASVVDSAEWRANGSVARHANERMRQREKLMVGKGAEGCLAVTCVDVLKIPSPLSNVDSGLEDFPDGKFDGARRNRRVSY